jgi:hypothetical protein
MIRNPQELTAAIIAAAGAVEAAAQKLDAAAKLAASTTDDSPVMVDLRAVVEIIKADAMFESAMFGRPPHAVVNQSPAEFAAALVVAAAKFGELSRTMAAVHKANSAGGVRIEMSGGIVIVDIPRRQQ